MENTGRFALAIALSVALAIAGLAAAVSRSDQDGLPTNELLQLEPLPSNPSSTAEGHLQFMFEVFGGQRRITDADGAERFTSKFIDAFAVEQLNEIADTIESASGGVRLVRIGDREPGGITGLGVADDGTTGQVVLAITPEGRIDGLVFTDYPGEPARLQAWESTLILAAVCTALGAAFVAWRNRAMPEAWTLLAASIPMLMAIAVLSDSSWLYTMGRILPGAAIVFAVVLLLPAPSVSRYPVVVGASVASAVFGAVAPLTRDADLIRHPAVVGSFIDDESLYRGLLASSAVLAALAMGAVGMVTFRDLASTSRSVRPALWIGTAIAGLFALAALGTSVDSLVGDGTMAAGPFRAMTLTALVAVPGTVIIRLVIARWARPELAALVIDLETEGTELQPAIAKALGDPALQLLTSPDGQRLLTEDGEEISVVEIDDDRTLTRIQSGDQLVGGLVHTSSLRREPARLEAVAAAAGMALDLRRLNEQVVHQLDEVDASRARILAASDDARRQLERDLHDGAQQRLVALGLLLQRARHKARGAGQTDLAILLQDATGEVRDTLEEIRGVARGRQPALLAERGLATAVDALAERAPIPVQLDITSDTFPPRVERTAYYVIAEGLTNVAKHSVASSAEVSIERRNGHAVIIIHDDGKGGAQVAAGSGLEGLNDRVAAAGGTFTISSDPTGTTLEASIPCG